MQLRHAEVADRLLTVVSSTSDLSLQQRHVQLSRQDLNSHLMAPASALAPSACAATVHLNLVQK